MKVAFHFDAGFPAFGDWYGPKVEKLTFSSLLGVRPLFISSKVYIGDLPFYLWNTDEARAKIVRAWSEQFQSGWHRFTDRIERIGECDTFVLCFEGMTKGLAEDLHKSLAMEEAYLGAVEVDDSSKVHWDLYSKSLRLSYRVIEDTIAVFFDELVSERPTDSEMDDETKRFLGIGFRSVKFESCTGRHSLFDRYHNFKHARRIAEWRSSFSDLLSFMVDEVICRLGDSIPELGNKLWAAVNTFESAETDEQYAQVSATCRRIIEHVADALFPATAEICEGRKLGELQYRNRLLAWMGDRAKSETNIELIASSLELFAKHVEKLQDLVNKGVHSDLQREGARRCLLRTVLLLDDIISLRPDSFPVKPDLDFSIFDRPIGDDPG